MKRQGLALQIDFAQPTKPWLQGTAGSGHWVWYMLCALLLAAILGILGFWWQLNTEYRQVNQSRQQVEAEIAAHDDATRDSAQNNQQASDDTATQIFAHLNYPWAGLLNHLETHSAENLTLVSAELGIIRQSNKLVLEAPNIDNALNYLQALQKSPHFAQLAIIRQELQGAEANGKSRFTLEAPQTNASEKGASK